MANLLTIAALCTGREPDEVAAEIGDGGAAQLKAVTTDAVDGLLAPIRARRARVSDADIDRVLKRGITAATRIAETTLAEVQHVMGMDVVAL